MTKVIPIPRFYVYLVLVALLSLVILQMHTNIISFASKTTNTEENKPPGNTNMMVSQSNIIDIESNSSLQLKTFSVAVWLNLSVNFPVGTNYHFIVNKGGEGNETAGHNMNYGIWIDDKERLRGGFETISGENHYLRSQRAYNDSKWHYVVLTYNGSSLNLYVDGTRRADKMTVALPDNTGNQSVSVGVNSLELDSFFTGHIDELRIFNRALSSREILEQYNFDRFNTQGQVLYLSFNTESR